MSDAGRGDGTLGLAIQSPFTDWGTDAQWETYQRLSRHIEALCQRHRFGTYDGCDQGRGTANVFVVGLPFDRWEAALRLVLQELHGLAVLDRAIVAQDTLDLLGEYDNAVRWRVVWPKGSRDQFHLFGPPDGIIGDGAPD